MKKRRFPRLTRWLLRLIPSMDPYHRPRLPFPRRSAERRSSFPFITGDTFRAACEHVFDETDTPFEPARVEHGDRIFVNGSMLKAFFGYAHTKIGNPYILVSHNTDHSIPGAFAGHLEDPRLIAWFTQNADRAHPKLFPIPIGLANAHWPHGDVSVVREVAAEAIERRHLAYANFSRKRQQGSRNDVWDRFRSAPFCHLSEDRPYREYLRDMRGSCFVISPPGNGPDCHRHWEALLMGSIPVMKHSPLDALFEDLPVLIVDDWSEVSRERLTRAEPEIRAHSCNHAKLYVGHWLELQRRVQARARQA